MRHQILHIHIYSVATRSGEPHNALHSSSIGSHDSDSLLGTTRVVSGARMLMYWAGSSQTPPQVKEGRYEAMGRPYQRSTARRNPRSECGAHGREERGRPSGPCFVF